MKDYSHHFRRILESELPGDSRVLTSGGGSNIVILASWRLKSDPLRASKRSRMIRVVLTDDAVEHYVAGAEDARLACDRRFMAWVQSQLAEFDPDHDSPLGVEPPTVTWTADRVTIHGGNLDAV